MEPLIPNIPFQLTKSHMGDLFANFAHNWNTLSPALWLLFGVLIAFFYLKVIKKLND
jgi:hypothetical protein